MKRYLLTLSLLFISLIAFSQTDAKSKSKAEPVFNKTKVEIACGECQFKMDGKGCDLAIRYKGKAYFVDGRHIDDFGDAHDKKTGYCNAIGKAHVTGEIVNGRFKARNIVPVSKK